MLTPVCKRYLISILKGFVYTLVAALALIVSRLFLDEHRPKDAQGESPIGRGLRLLGISIVAEKHTCLGPARIAGYFRASTLCFQEQ